MKDLIAKLQLDANCALGAIWMHINAQAKRIAELEAEKAKEFNCRLTMEGAKVIGNGGENPILHVPGGTVVDLSGYTLLAPGAPLPADTDKLRELRARIYEMKEAAYTYGDNSKETVCVALDGVLDEIDEVSSTALQAPVREVPEGWQLVPKEPTGVMKDAGAYALPVDYSSTSAAANAYRAMLAAAPVQREGE